jgi:hypothetical protein
MLLSVEHESQHKVNQGGDGHTWALILCACGLDGTIICHFV